MKISLRAVTMVMTSLLPYAVTSTLDLTCSRRCVDALHQCIQQGKTATMCITEKQNCDWTCVIPPIAETSTTPVVTTTKQVTSTVTRSQVACPAVLPLNKECVDELARTCRRGATEENLPANLRPLCDTKTDQGGWIVFQRRMSAEVNFNMNYATYESGFGDINTNYWLGLKHLHNLCNQKKQCQLWMNFRHQGTNSLPRFSRYKGKVFQALYDTFYVANADDDYRLAVRGLNDRYSNFTYDLMKYHSGNKFSTYDEDKDTLGRLHCGKEYQAGWWFRSCASVCLNCPWDTCNEDTNSMWLTGFGCPIQDTEMKLRQEAIASDNIISRSNKLSFCLVPGICGLLFVLFLYISM